MFYFIENEIKNLIIANWSSIIKCTVKKKVQISSKQHSKNKENVIYNININDTSIMCRLQLQWAKILLSLNKRLKYSTVARILT